MSTARDLVSRALRTIHVLDPGEVPSAGEAADSLEALNGLLEVMSLPGLYIYATREDIVSWTADQASRTIGTGGDFAITRPTRLRDGTFYRVSDSDYLLGVLRDRAQYSAIVDKTSETTHPEYIYYEPGYPTGTLYIWPVPSTTLSVHLLSESQLSAFATLDTAFSHPPGYYDLMTYELAIRLAPEFGVAVPPEVTNIVARVRRDVKRTNAKRPVSVIEIADTGRYSVYSDS